MKHLEIFDPAMCCSSGVCGPSVDAKLVQLASFLQSLDPRLVRVDRYNLAQQPGAYAAHPIVADLLKQEGTQALPLFIVDGTVLTKGQYPQIKELSRALGVLLPL